MATFSEAQQKAEFCHRLLRQKRYSEVVRTILNEESGRLRSPFSVIPNHAWYILGDVKFRTKYFQAARKYFGNSLKADPGDTQAMMALANCYSELDQPASPRRLLLRALKLEPRNLKFRYNLGNGYFDLKLFEKASVEFAKASKSSDGDLALLARKNLAVAKRWCLIEKK